MLCKLHSISYNPSYIYIYIVKCFCKISQKLLFPAENQPIHSENRAAPGENGWNSLDFTVFPINFAGFRCITQWFLLISSETHRFTKRAAVFGWISPVSAVNIRVPRDLSAVGKIPGKSQHWNAEMKNPETIPPMDLRLSGGLSCSCTPAPREKIWVCNSSWTCIFTVWCLPRNPFKLFRLSRNFLVIAFLCFKKFLWYNIYRKWERGKNLLKHFKKIKKELSIWQT